MWALMQAAKQPEHGGDASPSEEQKKRTSFDTVCAVWSYVDMNSIKCSKYTNETSLYCV